MCCSPLIVHHLCLAHTSGNFAPLCSSIVASLSRHCHSSFIPLSFELQLRSSVIRSPFECQSSFIPPLFKLVAFKLRSNTVQTLPPFQHRQSWCLFNLFFIFFFWSLPNLFSDFFHKVRSSVVEVNLRPPFQHHPATCAWCSFEVCSRTVKAASFCGLFERERVYYIVQIWVEAS